MTSSNQVTILDSTFDRDDTEVMIGIGPAFAAYSNSLRRQQALVLLAPIFLMAAIAIKLDSRGPIFIRDSQLGPSNRVVPVFRFRLAKRGIWQRSNLIGLVLNGTGVDHLPQLFNVLRGEMSLADLLRTIGRDGAFLP